MFFAGCSDEYGLFNDELTITGEYEEIVVLYANIDLSSKLNLIRVNRGFSADNFHENSNMPDSIQFAPGANEVRFHKIYKGDTTTYVCYDTLVDKEDSELFNTEKVLMHAFRADDLLAYDLDDLHYVIEVRTQDGTKTSSSTTPVGRFSFLRPLNSWDEYCFGQDDFQVNIEAPLNSQAYEITADVGYRDFRLNGRQIDTVNQQFRFTIVRHLASRPSGGVHPISGSEPVFRVAVQSDKFYAALASHIRQNSDTVNTVYRKFRGVVFNATCGNPDLAQVMSVNPNSLGFAENFVYNNVNNGFGYVSAYTKCKTHKLPVSMATVFFVGEKYPQFRFR
jgi:hypothetical protein